MKKLIVLGCLAVALVFPASAFALWGWTPSAAEDTLYQEGLDWDTGHERVRFADCKGFKQGPSFVDGGVRYFRKLTCFVRTNVGGGQNSYFIRIIVQGEFRWTHVFLRYA